VKTHKIPPSPSDELLPASDPTAIFLRQVYASPAREEMADFPDMLVPGYLPADSFVIVPGMDGRAKPRSAAEIGELADSIQAEGQQEAIEYILHSQIPGKNIVTKGHGRLTAILGLLAQEKTWPNGPGVKAVLSDRAVTSDDWETIRRDFYLSGLHNNIHRHNLKPADIAHDIEVLSRPPFNLQDQEIADRIRISASYISQHRAYARTIPRVREAVDSGRLAFRGLRVFVGKTEKQQARLLDQMEARAERRDRAAAGKRNRPRSKGRRRPVLAPPVTSKPKRPQDKNRSPASSAMLEQYIRKGANLALRSLLGAVARYVTLPPSAPVEKRVEALRLCYLEARKFGRSGCLTHRLHAGLPGKPKENKRRTTPPAKTAPAPEVPAPAGGRASRRNREIPR
jgi:ParB-like chromosome segregation protein Spo0J